MKIPQLSVFVENRPGHLIRPCRVLAEAGINVVTLSLAETQAFGILRLIVRDWQQAKQTLESAGIAVSVTEVVAIEVDDRPGGLVDVLALLEKAGINVEYMYAFATKAAQRAVLVFRVDDPDAAIAALGGSQGSVVGRVALFDRA